MTHYKYRNQILAMNDTAISTILEGLEGRMRTSEVTYCEKPDITNEHLASIKASWPEDLIALVRARATQIAAGNPVNGTIAYQAIRATLLDELPKRRQANAAVATTAKHMERAILADLSLSMALSVPPHVGNEPIRVIKGKRVDVRPLIGTTRLVVNDTEIDNADVYVCALLNEQVSKAILLGWTTRDFLRQAEHGNKNTDPDHCSWSRMSFWMRLDKLHPMIELMRMAGVKNSSPGFLLESIPAADELPIPDPKLDDLLPGKTATTAKDNWYSSMGLPDPMAATTAGPDPTPKKEDDFSF